MNKNDSVLIIGKFLADTGYQIPYGITHRMSIVIIQDEHVSVIKKNRYGPQGMISTSMLPRFLENPASFVAKKTLYGSFLLPQ